MQLRAADIRVGMVLGGRRLAPRLVVGNVQRIPLIFDYWGVRVFGRDLYTNEVEQVSFQTSALVEVIDLPTRYLEFVCCQDAELLLIDPKSEEVYSVPQSDGGPWVRELQSGERVRVSFHCGLPLWVHGQDAQEATW
jgi:translation elongation factor P/translation initiation factor 5A